MIDVTLDEIEAVSYDSIRAHGAQDWIATSMAKAVRRAEETGNIICGLYYLESYCTQLKSGRVDGNADPVVAKPRPGSVLADAKLGFAQPAFERAMPQVVSAARENGIAALGVAHSHTCTSLGYFTEQLANQGLLAIGFTNASPVVAAPGGKNRVIGTNPIAYSVPGRDGGVAVHFDAATSATALGAITMAKSAGRDIPLGWAVDSNGDETTDPSAALEGALLSAGGYRGFGFGLLAEFLAAGMTGSVNSVDVSGLKLPDGKPHDLGQFYMVVDVSSMSDAFFDRFDRLEDAIRYDEGARLPGAIRKSLDPVKVDPDLWAKLSSLAGR